MKIYTKTGDKGTTSLYDGSRVSKDSLRVHTYGTLDELNAHVSLCEKKVAYEHSQSILHTIQHQLFHLCAEVATKNIEKLRQHSTLITQGDIESLEAIIDTYTAQLPKVQSFILSGKCEAAAELHIARTVARRSERLLIQLHHEEPLRPELLQYVNRLSDVLYILARMEDAVYHVETIVQKVQDKVMAMAKEDIPTPTCPCQSLLHEMGEMAIEVAKKKAVDIGVPVVISIVDDHGLPVLFYRMEGALLVSIELAPQKAYTAVALKCETQALSQAVQPGADLFQLESMVHKPIVTFGGGFPIRMGDAIIGGLGISGGTVEEDVLIGNAVLHAWEEAYGNQ